MSINCVMSNDDIYREMESDILRFRLKPGETISESQLCSRYNLSRTPIRSVMQRLQEKGLVQIVPRKGTIVTLIDYNIVNQTIYQRVAVETMVLRDFIRTCSPADVEMTRFALTQMQQIGALNETDHANFHEREFLSLDLKMHETWFRATNKLDLWGWLSNVHADYTRFCTLDIIDGNNVADVLNEHTEMMRLIDTRDEAGIEPLIRRHLYGGVRRLGGLIFTKYAGYFLPYVGNEGRA